MVKELVFEAEQQCTLISDKTDLLPGTVIFSDQSKNYSDFTDYIEVQISEKSSKQTTVETLESVHIAINNAKRNLLGVYHMIKGRYLQNYLDEFVYKLNSRYFKSIFE